MKKNASLVEAFTDANTQICKTRPAVEPRDIYLAYCAFALCTIADKMTYTKPEGRVCDSCKHNGFPDGDAACLTCCKYYDCQYKEKP